MSCALTHRDPRTRSGSVSIRYSNKCMPSTSGDTGSLLQSLTCRRFSGLSPALLFRPKGVPAKQIGVTINMTINDLHAT